MEPQPHPTTLATPLATTAVHPPFAAPRAFVAGNAISRSFGVWWKNVVPFTLLSVGVYAPMILAFALAFRWLLTAEAAGAPPDMSELPTFVAVTGVVVLATMVLGLIQFGAVTHGAVQQLGGRRARLGEMLGTGVRRSLPLAGMLFLGSLAVGAGFLLLFVPGVMLLVAWSVAVPAAVIERNGPFAALSRSRALTRGHRWQVFAVFLALIGIVWVLSLFVQMAALAISAIFLPRELAAVAPVVLSQLGNALFSALPAVGAAVVYHDLRVAKEGVQTEQLAAVFE